MKYNCKEIRIIDSGSEYEQERRESASRKYMFSYIMDPGELPFFVICYFC